MTPTRATPGQSSLLKQAAALVAAMMFLLCLLDAISSLPHITGDGNEYLMYTQNLARGNGPNLVEVPADIPQRYKTALNRLRPGGAARRLGSGQIADAFIRDGEGRTITWHWWGYSALLLPAYVAFRALGMDPAYCFVVTNLALVVLLLAYLARYSRQSAEFRALYACMFMLCGTSYYVWWSHPEVMCAALSALGLVAWLDRRNTLSIACIAIASTQNPPIALLILLPAASALSVWREAARAGAGWRSATLRLLPAVLTGAIVFVPSAWYLSRVGVMNPILADGAAQFKTGDFAKALDLFFDLNQGMILLQAGSFLLIVVYLITAAIGLQGSAPRGKAPLPLVYAMLGAAYAMAVLAASAYNWNAGSTVISRYSYWLSVPIVFVVSLVVTSLPRPILRNLAGLFVVLAGIAMMAPWGVQGRDSSWLEFTRASRIAMRLFPRSYFSEPEVFCERAQGREDCDYDRPYVAWLPGRRPLRVLAAQRYVLKQCDGRLPLEQPTRRERDGRKVLLWFSGPVTCPSGRRIDQLAP